MVSHNIIKQCDGIDSGKISLFRILAKIKYLLNDYKGALMDLNRADKVNPDNHITLRYVILVYLIYLLRISNAFLRILR